MTILYDDICKGLLSSQAGFSTVKSRSLSLPGDTYTIIIFRRPSRFGRILSPPRVLIRAQRNLAYLLRTIFSKKCWKWNFDFLPLKFFMGVQSQNLAIFGHFWRFSARHSVAFPNGTLIFFKNDSSR